MGIYVVSAFVRTRPRSACNPMTALCESLA